MAVQTNLLMASISTAASGQTQLVAAPPTFQTAVPTAAQAIYVVSYVIVASGAVTVQFQSGATNLTGAMALAANGGVVAISDGTDPILQCAPGTALNINLGSAVQVSGHLSYFLF